MRSATRREQRGGDARIEQSGVMVDEAGNTDDEAVSACATRMTRRTPRGRLEATALVTRRDTGGDMHLSLKQTAVVGTVVLATLGLVACGGDDNSSSSGGSTSSTSGGGAATSLTQANLKRDFSAMAQLKSL